MSSSFDSLIVSNSDSQSDATHVPGWRAGAPSGEAFSSLSSSESLDLQSASSDETGSFTSGNTLRFSADHINEIASNLLNSTRISTPFSSSNTSGKGSVMKRGSILNSANQDMLCTLNKMFSSPPDSNNNYSNYSATSNNTSSLFSSTIALGSSLQLQQQHPFGGRAVSACRSRTPSGGNRRGSVGALPSTIQAVVLDDRPKEPKKSQSKLLKVCIIKLF